MKLRGAKSTCPVPVLQMKQVLQYYMNLFTSQYRLSPNLQQWQTAMLTPIDDLTNCIQGFNGAYDIDCAIGAQLDILGQIVGVSRTVPFQPSNGVSPVLDDTTYRLLLYATIARNTWNGTITSLYQIWQYLFPSGQIIIADQQNMSAIITTTGTFTSIVNDLISNGLIVPRPEGVLYNYVVGQSGKLFGFDQQTATIDGFDNAVWALN